MTDDMPHLFAFNRWADGRVIEVCRTLDAEAYTRELPGGMLSVRLTLVHIAGATIAWSRRLSGVPIAGPIAESDLPTVDVLASALGEAHDFFDRLAAEAGPEKLASLLIYRNFQGVEVRVPIWAVLRHVVNHASYHRGQVAVKLKRLGVEPPSTDLVSWAILQTPQG